MEISRYSNLIKNGKIKDMPPIKINNRSTDIFMTYDSNKTRLDRIAYEVYADDTLYWLILLANPEYYSEFDIPYKSVIRVPFPLQDVMAEFLVKINNNQVM